MAAFVIKCDGSIKERRVAMRLSFEKSGRLELGALCGLESEGQQVLEHLADVTGGIGCGTADGSGEAVSFGERRRVSNHVS